MLRTFDELGYRQEQRFHFELGLIKLVHLRRLLPIEEALSHVTPGSGSSTRNPAATPQPRSAAPPRSATTAQAAAAPPRATFSPFERDKRRRPEGATSSPIRVSEVPSHAVPETRGATAISVAPNPTPRPTLESVPQATSVVLPVAPPPAAHPTHSIASGAADDPQQSVVAALADAKQTSAADAMADAAWTIADGEATVQTELSKTMLPVVMNQDAEKITRATLRDAGIHRLTLLPGVAAPAAAKKVRAARSGSVHAKALEHPMVQQAQKLFEADIQTVIDLRDND